MNVPKKIVCIHTPVHTHNPILAVLTQHGFDVVQAPGTAACVRTVSQEIPDVVLLELSGGQHGLWDTYYQIRKSPQTCNIPIILLAPKATRIEEVQQLYAADAADYLTLPAAPRDLLTCVEQVLIT
jgi:DNA-binding response OmpR family regulator